MTSDLIGANQGSLIGQTGKLQVVFQDIQLVSKMSMQIAASQEYTVGSYVFLQYFNQSYYLESDSALADS